MDLYLKGKTAVITGASQGIGKAIAIELAREGVQVFAVGRNQQLLQELIHDVKALNGVVPLTFTQDMVATDSVQNIANAALTALGQVDILINNAGRSQPVDVVGPEEPWVESMTLDFDRHRQLTQALLPGMISGRTGTILNLTSTYELRFLNASSIAKAAIVMWSKQLAGQLGQHGIRVNCLQPGLIDTENIRRMFTTAERKAHAAQEIPLGDFGEPQDMANMAAFLVSPRASYITGTVAVVDGGARRYAF
ncbi:SDR family NAD(P)-dependent oxidoreductase [Mucilaginibacter aquatilis]|uniref:SDR family oxidoreductase n=1 Tax=Mucilaginibacter aquatilis TaxID=1517760 RepID=A0A6I4IDS4_9SPHI|nr:SDR family oxidoreductase [Mucilaginibacter aquatilis]MVN91519.1 SDR family oxidoreductase [Mucilaginibacter aquatilis]